MSGKDKIIIRIVCVYLGGWVRFAYYVVKIGIAKTKEKKKRIKYLAVARENSTGSNHANQTTDYKHHKKE